MSLDIDYINVDYIPGGAEYPDRWEAEGQAYRQREAAIGRARLNVPYGERDRNRFDLFHPAGKPKGLVVFVHGGYWIRFDRHFWSHFSAGLTARGWAVAIPSAPLAPEARVRDMTREVARAVETAAGLVPGPIRLVGHSAGGHLVARMGCRDVVLDADVRARIAHILPLSPVSDLRPLRKIAMNDTLRLNEDEARTESPVLHPAPDISVTVWVGAEERPVFLDQAIWLSEAWRAPLRLDPGRHHFDLLNGLEDAESPMVESILGSLD